MSALNLTPLECCDRAADLLRQAGFEFVTASMKSTSCYYRLPGYEGTLRVSIHGRKRDRRAFHNSGPVLAHVTFPIGSASRHGMLNKGGDYLLHVVATGIGHYLIKAHRPKSSAKTNES